jgi:hypothetical protein
MRVTQNARRSLAAAGLALALAGCSKDGSGPSEFNPQGVAADMGAAQDAFASGPTASFAAMGTDISTVLGASALTSSPMVSMLTHPSKPSAEYVRKVASLVRSGGPRIQASVAAIPSELAGVTFVWADSEYVASDLSGAPANGVRFLLYAVDPVLLRPVEPLVETGYVDVIDLSTATQLDVRVRVVQGAITYLDYDVVSSATSSSGIVTISGFAFNGSVRANFTLKNTVSQTAGGGIVLSLDYDLDVPARNLSIDWTATFANISDTEVAVTLDLAISGPNGDVRLVGTTGADGGTFTVKVNGDTFATITISVGGMSITGAGQEPLTPDEEEALQAVLDSYEASLDAFSHLLMPVS